MGSGRLKVVYDCGIWRSVVLARRPTTLSYSNRTGKGGSSLRRITLPASDATHSIPLNRIISEVPQHPRPLILGISHTYRHTRYRTSHYHDIMFTVVAFMCRFHTLPEETILALHRRETILALHRMRSADRSAPNRRSTRSPCARRGRRSAPASP